MKRPPEHAALLALVEDYRAKLEKAHLCFDPEVEAPVRASAWRIASDIRPWAPFASKAISGNRFDALTILEEIQIL